MDSDFKHHSISTKEGPLLSGIHAEVLRGMPCGENILLLKKKKCKPWIPTIGLHFNIICVLDKKPQLGRKKQRVTICRLTPQMSTSHWKLRIPLGFLMWVTGTQTPESSLLAPRVPISRIRNWSWDCNPTTPMGLTRPNTQPRSYFEYALWKRLQIQGNL